MGRPELPVDHTVPARGELAEALRVLRTGAGLTYSELAVTTGLSPATLKRAASGRILPSWETAKEFALACGILPADLRPVWLKARIAERGRLKQLRRPRSPELATTFGDLGEAMEYFYEAAGAPSLRQLQERAGGRHLLPLTSAARIVNREALPASRQQCLAFLTACGLPDRVAERWAQAFDRITSHREPDPELLSDLEAVLTITMENAGRWALHKQIDRRFEPSLPLRAVRRRPETQLGVTWTREHLARQILSGESRAA
ncbi:helix-turn-helix domain-containing protein [Streptomyces yangpuensis]|uniref:helix-turn-helix domain-containing protein n=1 Tax=Streptomyces yangpuensis TaxID=1648182 RepID=UPI00366002E6